MSLVSLHLKGGQVWKSYVTTIPNLPSSIQVDQSRIKDGLFCRNLSCAGLCWYNLSTVSNPVNGQPPFAWLCWYELSICWVVLIRTVHHLRPWFASCQPVMPPPRSETVLRPLISKYFPAPVVVILPPSFFDPCPLHPWVVRLGDIYVSQPCHSLACQNDQIKYGYFQIRQHVM